MSQEAIARSCGLVVPLLDLGPLSGLRLQFERWMEIIHIQANCPIQASQALTGDQAREAVVAHEPANHRAILLFDPGLIVLLIGPRARELEMLFLAIALECLVDEYSGPQKVDHSGYLHLLRLFPSQ